MDAIGALLRWTRFRRLDCGRVVVGEGGRWGVGCGWWLLVVMRGGGGGGGGGLKGDDEVEV